MTIRIIFIYCLCDELLNAIKHHDDCQSMMSNAEIMTFAITATLYFHGNYAKTHLFFSSHKYFSYLLGRSRLNKRLLRIPQETWVQVLSVCHACLNDRKNREYIVDSFPVPVCHNARISRCKLLREKCYHGYCSSKKMYFFGIKVHILVTADGVPVEVVFTPASESDIRAFKRMNLDLEENAIIYADKAYTDYMYEDLLLDAKIHLCSHRKRNAKRQHSFQLTAIQKYKNPSVHLLYLLRLVFFRIIDASTSAITSN